MSSMDNRDWWKSPHQGDRQRSDYGRCGPIADEPYDYRLTRWPVGMSLLALLIVCASICRWVMTGDLATAAMGMLLGIGLCTVGFIGGWLVAKWKGLA